MKKVVIVGRPNVGKSTLFNRLAGRRAALTGSTPGLTRDRREELVFINDREIMLSDTAGLEDLSALAQRMRQQTEVAVQAADLCLLVLDGGDGLLPEDHAAVRLLRKTGVLVLPIVNKADRREAENVGYTVVNLGFGEPVFVSAEHGEGIATLCAIITERLPEDAAVPEGARPLRLAIVGRPNAGKSTLINTLLGEERLLTGPEPGLTRDSVSVPFRFAGHSFLLHDTAGMRRKSRVIDINEQASVDDTLRALRFADAVVLLTDAPRSFEKQDLQIAELTANEGRAMVIGLNKWDTVGTVDLNDVRSYTDKMLPQMRGVPVVPCAGASGYGLEALLRAVLLQEQRRNRRIPTGPLNRFLREMTERHPLPAVGGRRLRIKYMTQIKTRPPTFALFVSNPEGMPEDYLRYLTNGLREAFDLPGVPLRLHMRRSAGDNPYADAERADHALLMGKRSRGR